ncbi:MAG TPA: hypothetical protein VLM85_10750 [Polyangiaceae bacterium]|nr:hypothetical protein [Polyangiaceae bacterium]
MEGTGAVINASGKATVANDVADRVLPLLGLFGAATYHPGGTAVATYFAMAGHVAYMPIFYGLMHYVALMSKSGVDGKTALDYFQLTSRTMVDGFAPMLAPAFERHDYSVFFGGHELFRDIQDCVAETCKMSEIDPRLAQLMADYYRRALQDPELANKSFQSVHEVICERRAR